MKLPSTSLLPPFSSTWSLFLYLIFVLKFCRSGTVNPKDRFHKRYDIDCEEGNFDIVNRVNVSSANFSSQNSLKNVVENLQKYAFESFLTFC